MYTNFSPEWTPLKMDFKTVERENLLPRATFSQKVCRSMNIDSTQGFRHAFHTSRPENFNTST